MRLNFEKHVPQILTQLESLQSKTDISLGFWWIKNLDLQFDLSFLWYKKQDSKYLEFIVLFFTKYLNF